MTPGAPRAVLFDLDGTLVDSAPDLAGTANDMRTSRCQAPLPYSSLRPHAGSGARGMLGAALSITPAQPGYDILRDEFLQRYAARMLRLSAPFPQTVALLAALDRRGLRWGIVTNKSLLLAERLAQATGVLHGAAVLVAGDCTPHVKPHPAPLLEAARRLGVAPADCIYVGDDVRDMQAGRAAGMRVLAAAWGYLGADTLPEAWGADHVLQQPADLLQWLDLA